MRRTEKYMYQFASSVGKRSVILHPMHAIRQPILSVTFSFCRMLAERIISRGRTSIIEHHRAVSWAEREYKALYNLLSTECMALRKQVEEAAPEDVKDFQEETRTKRQDRRHTFLNEVP